VKSIALVTGASGGMGADFARLIAKEGKVDEVWAVARRGDRLEALAKQSGGGAVIVPIVADLTTALGLAAIRTKLEAEKPELSLLVLNAGFGQFGGFEAGAKEQSLGMIDLNVRALAETAKDSMPYLAKGSGLILVASLAGFAPMGNLAVYSATKAFVLAFGVALSAELKERGIGVTILSPGPVATGFAEVASAGGGSGFSRGAAKSVDVVERCLEDRRRGRLYSYGRASWRAGAILVKFLPRRFVARATMGLMRD
jgi:short-subunit dehydrogenase